jgi:hypothetical protein
MTKQKITLWCTIAVLLSSAPAGAEGIMIRPGLWETTTTMESPFMPTMPARRTTECVQESSYDLDRMLSGARDCKISDRIVTADSVKWQMSCETDGGPAAKGEGQLTVQGDRVEGHMTIQMEFQGKRTDTKTSWSGRRLGDC